ncbi:MAG: Sensor protein CitS [Pelotomaculum sp. PtaB.Bin104]|nr:MAG: Sensor protein CitS [Pelotomaculum sp. PtaB.Bin104]
MDQMDILSLLFVSFPESMLIVALGFLLIGIRPWWRDLLIIGVLQTIISLAVRNAPVPLGLTSILEILLFTLNILLVTRLPYRVSMIVLLMGLIVYGAVETVVLPFMLYVSGYSIDYVLDNTAVRILFFVPQGLLMLAIILTFKFTGVSLISYSQEYGHPGEYLSRIDFQKIIGADVNIKQNLQIYFVILMPLLLLVILNTAFIAYKYNTITSDQLNILTMLYGVFIAVLTALSTGAVKRIGKYIEKEYEAKRAMDNLKQIEQLVDSSRKQRHDFRHQLQTVYGLLESGSYDRARDFAEKLFSTATKTGELIRTDNLSISALLNTKMGLAEARNIDLDISIECSLQDIPLTPLEASSLLGNLIDNAMDAVEEGAGGQGEISMTITFERGSYVITCSNTGAIDPQVRQNLLETNFTTKPGHSGLGLPIIKDIVTKYKGDIDVKSDEQETTFIITIPFSKRRSDAA